MERELGRQRWAEVRDQKENCLKRPEAWTPVIYVETARRTAMSGKEASL